MKLESKLVSEKCNMPDSNIDGVLVHQEDEDTYYVFSEDGDEFIGAIDFEYIPERAVVEVLYSRFSVMHTLAVAHGDQVQADKLEEYIRNLDLVRSAMVGASSVGAN